MTIFIWILATLVGSAFTFFSIVKLFGAPEALYQEQKAMWDHFGLTRTHVVLIGLAELFGGLSVWLWATQFQPVAQAGLAGLIVVTAGAMFYHYRDNALIKDGFPAIMQFIFSTTILAYTLL